MDINRNTEKYVRRQNKAPIIKEIYYIITFQFRLLQPPLQTVKVKWIYSDFTVGKGVQTNSKHLSVSLLLWLRSISLHFQFSQDHNKPLNWRLKLFAISKLKYLNITKHLSTKQLTDVHIRWCCETEILQALTVSKV